MIQLYCGDGKGKTTAAIGSAIRAAGAGYQVLFLQFMKGNETSELAVLEQIPQIKIARSPRNFGFFGQMSQQDKEALTDIHNQLLEQMEHFIGRTCQQQPLMVVLDEITYAYQWKLLDSGKLLDLLELAQVCDGGERTVEVILTGRDPGEKLWNCADYITENTCVRHPYEKEIGARRGIEY